MSARFATSVARNPSFNDAPVNNRIRKSVALHQCTIRSVRSKRGNRTTRGVEIVEVMTSRSRRRGVVTAVRATDPSVDVVAVLLPVPRDHVVGDLDTVEPLARLVAVHG